MPDEDSVDVAVGLDDSADADELANWLREQGGQEVEVHDHSEDQGILPFIGIVIGVALGVAALIKFIEHIRAKHQYEQIITYHDGKIKIQIVKEVRNGKILVFADKDTVVQIDDVPELLDLTDIAKTALTAGAEAAKDAVDAAKGAAKVTKPDDPPTKDALTKMAEAA